VLASVVPLRPGCSRTPGELRKWGVKVNARLGTHFAVRFANVGDCLKRLRDRSEVVIVDVGDRASAETEGGVDVALTPTLPSGLARKRKIRALSPGTSPGKLFLFRLLESQRSADSPSHAEPIQLLLSQVGDCDDR